METFGEESLGLFPLSRSSLYCAPIEIEAKDGARGLWVEEDS